MLSALIINFVSILALSPLATSTPAVAEAMGAFTVPRGIRASSLAELPYPLVPMGYRHSIDGRDVALSGSAEEIVNQIRSIDPGFSVNSTLTSTSSDSLLPRGKYPGNILCCPVAAWGWQGANTEYIYDGIDYLQGISGSCHFSPRSCSRVSCSYNAGIYFCNDNTYDIYPTCSYIASYAIDLITICGVWPDFAHGGTPTVCGQEFDSDRYNVIVHSDNC